METRLVVIDVYQTKDGLYMTVEEVKLTSVTAKLPQPDKIEQKIKDAVDELLEEREPNPQDIQILKFASFED